MWCRLGWKRNTCMRRVEVLRISVSELHDLHVHSSLVVRRKTESRGILDMEQFRVGFQVRGAPGEGWGNFSTPHFGQQICKSNHARKKSNQTRAKYNLQLVRDRNRGKINNCVQLYPSSYIQPHGTELKGQKRFTFFCLSVCQSVFLSVPVICLSACLSACLPTSLLCPTCM